jgi:hypothetical protein
MRTLFLVAVVLAGCGRAKEGAKDLLNGGGQLAGKAATEMVEGVATGVEHTWKADVRLSDALRKEGLALGVVQVESDPAGRNNRMEIYLTSTSAFHDTLRVVAFDRDSLEMGRASLPLALKPGSGDYYEVRFPDRTDLGRKGHVVIEAQR